jgi:hypothetical protein
MANVEESGGVLATGDSAACEKGHRAYVLWRDERMVKWCPLCKKGWEYVDRITTT